LSGITDNLFVDYAGDTVPLIVEGLARRSGRDLRRRAQRPQQSEAPPNGRYVESSELTQNVGNVHTHGTAAASANEINGIRPTITANISPIHKFFIVAPNLDTSH
jgi:hypothetical protein